ncbi:MAG: hypothetical protein ACKVP5_09290 [Aestuariivirga sp.]
MTTSLTVEPSPSCPADGGCAPWLRVAAFGVGALAAAFGLIALWRNPRWGSIVDLASRTLVWWNEPKQTSPQRIDLDQVAAIQFGGLSDNSYVYLLDRDGQRLAFPPEDMVPYPCDRWAMAVQRKFPHIRIEKMD